MTEGQSKKTRVGLFVTCLVDLMRPSVGFAAVRLLEAAGCDVAVPGAQTCCGQPGYNSGDTASARALAKRTIAAFEDFDFIVVPSGSCAAMLKRHYAELLADDEEAQLQVRSFSERVHELLSFLVNVCAITSVPGTYEGRVTYHDGCSGLRELGIKMEARKLLESVPGLELVEMADCEVCCGFGGLFSVKFPELSAAIAAKKTACIDAVGPDLVLAGELGCLMNIAGKLSRDDSGTGCRHVAEVLAGEMDAPPICWPGKQP